MNRVITSYLQKFCLEHSFEDLSEADQFELFVNFCIVNQLIPDQFDPRDMTTSSDDNGIDGLAVLIDGYLATTAEAATSVFKGLGKRRSVFVQYIFVQSKRSEGFDLGEMLKLGAGVSSLVQSKDLPADELLAEFIGIHEVIVKNLSNVDNGRPTCSLYYATTGRWNETSGLRDRAIEPTVSQLKQTAFFHNVLYEPVDNERLIGLWVRAREPISATFQVKGAVPLPAIANVVEAYLALAPAIDFVNNVLSDKDGHLKLGVFEQNVRSFLGDENRVNSRMRESLVSKDQHDRFAINNNGITIISPDVRVQSDRISVTDYQIVNGCQTSHTLYRNRSLLSENVWIPIKVIEANAEDVISQVVESTNSQTNVDEAQFLSIRPFSRRVENYFDAFDASDLDKERRLYFERRTNQYSGEEIGKARIFDIPKLARCVAAMFYDIPHIAYMYPTSVLRERANTFYRVEHKERAYYVAALALYRLELALGNNYVPRKYQSYKWHMLMLVKYLVAGPETPKLENGRIEAYCEKIEDALGKGGKASAPPFLDAAKILEHVGMASRDRRKGQPYSDEIKIEAIKIYKKRAAKKSK